MQTRGFIVGVAAMMILAAMPCAEAENLPEKSEWHKGDEWVISVKLYTRPYVVARSSGKCPAISVRDEYQISVMVTGEVGRGGGDCWELEFVPGEDAPSEIRKMKYRLLVAKKTGVIETMTAVVQDGDQKGTKKTRLRQIQGLRFGEVRGFPVTVIPWKHNFQRHDKNKKSEEDYWTASIDTKEMEKRKMLYQLKVENKPGEYPAPGEFTVWQKWSPEHSWWTEHIRFDHQGHKVLSAKLKKKSK